MRNPPERFGSRIAAAIPPEMRAAVEAEAKAHGVSESAVLRWALKAYFPALRDGPTAPVGKAS